MQKRTYQKRTIESLRLDLKSAQEGKTWLLLPEGFRDQGSGLNYPLPSALTEIQLLSTIYIPPQKSDSGCVYIRRAIKKLREKSRLRQSAVLDISRRLTKIGEAQENYNARIKEARQEINATIDAVRKEAEAAVANLNDLFTLGRKGIEAQMRAYLSGSEFQGEVINGRAFRECFRMVSQAVKGLGLPSDQRPAAEKAVVDELAASLEATQDAISQATTTEGTEH